MKITQFRPARAACAATAVARLPVEAHDTVLKPNSRALLIATETTRSLYDKRRMVIDGIILDVEPLDAELRAEPFDLDQNLSAAPFSGSPVDRQQFAIPPKIMGTALNSGARDSAALIRA